MAGQTHHETRFWADEEADLLDPAAAHVIRDSKTPSGAVPISGLRGPIITDALYRTFKKRGLKIRYVFTIDDYDPMDSQSLKDNAAWREHMGKPFANIPSPEPSVASDFARYHASAYLATFDLLGIRPEEIHWMRDLYRKGELDRQIDLVLRNAATIREVYARVSNVKKDERWLPIGVICESCRRLGTTYAYDYDGQTVAYECRKDYVTWAEGCGHSGRVSPFKGNAKLYWNLQWCAMWDHFGVTYEEGGKDLLTAGGSRDRADEIYRQVWKKEPPIGLVHEFFTTAGKKMSTSKGLGAAATDLVAAYPPELVRFLMLRTHPKRHVEFDPAGMTLPRLVDEYDRCGDAFVKEPDSGPAKTWALSQVAEEPAPPGFRVRFSIVADWLQIPSVDPQREAESRKGAPLTSWEKTDLDRRIVLARTWLQRWAPDEAKFSVLPQLPEDVALTDAQRRYLDEVKKLVGATRDPEALMNELYEAAKRVGLTSNGKVSQDAFGAIYKVFLGKPSGPKAAWLLTTLAPDFVSARLDAAVRSA